MARYKHYDYRQSKLLPVSFEEQILPGSFEHTLCYLIDEELDLCVFRVNAIADSAARRSPIPTQGDR